MSNSVLVSKENIQTILTQIVAELNTEISNIKLSDADITKLQVINYLVTTGDGSKFLTDNGTYQTVDVSGITDASQKISVIYDIFKISGSSYTLTLPPDLQAKVDLLKSTGDGSNVLADDGTYKNLQGLLVTTLTDTEVSTLISSTLALI